MGSLHTPAPDALRELLGTNNQMHAMQSTLSLLGTPLVSTWGTS